VKIKLNNGDSFYINKNSYSAVNMVKHNYNANPEYSVTVVVGGGFSVEIYKSESKESAEDAMFKLGEQLDEDSSEKTYLDGFKEGTEYALKLMSKG